MTPTSGGTKVIDGWYQAIIGWALVLAVAAIIVSAAMWAIGNLRYTPQTSSRGKWGVVVSVVAAMLLGGSKVYLQFLYDKWAPGFAPDPASYAVADDPVREQFTVLDKSAVWDLQVTSVRKAQGYLVPVSPDPQLVQIATACANKLAGAEAGICPDTGAFWQIEYTSATTAMLDGLPDASQLAALRLVQAPPEGAPAVTRIAWVAVTNNETKHSFLVAILASEDCSGSCVIDGDGVLQGPIVSIVKPGGAPPNGGSPIGGG